MRQRPTRLGRRHLPSAPRAASLAAAAAALTLALLASSPSVAAPPPGIAALPATIFQAQAPAPGRKVFEAQKCALCHSVESLGIEAKTKSDKLRGEDLSTVGDERERVWLVAFLEQKQKLDGSLHKKGFKGTDEELQALVDWLLELKAVGGGG